MSSNLPKTGVTLIAYVVGCCFASIFGKASVQTLEAHFLKTQWDTEVSSTNCPTDYPRPTMVRGQWLNLNGIWDFGLGPLTKANSGIFTGKILVPFPVESMLSGAECAKVAEDRRMWYRRAFNVPLGWKGQRVLLHFDAVDWETKVWVNDKELATHRGGYDSFSFDITDALKPEGVQQLTVSVFDPSDSGAQPRGKQMEHPHPPFFHTSSGIWQTVWLEPVATNYIVALNLVPDVDARRLRATVQICGQTNGMIVEATALAGGREVSDVVFSPNTEIQMSIPHARLWSPDTPFLYDLKVLLSCDGKIVDSVTGYFGMRKISIAMDKKGRPKLMLNNQPYFQLGPLDQGYWPDGIYTAPTDKAMRHDIEVTKELGFNMCRKHVKVEPERWYYWCDKLGLLVWQDMPNAGPPVALGEKEIEPKPAWAQQFEGELTQMVRQRGNHPSVVVWVLFNQAWGQHETDRLTQLIKEEDPSRLVLSASGWNDMKTGDILSLHGYPIPPGLRPDGKRACVIGECGGLSSEVPGHIWGSMGRWNAIYFKDSKGLLEGYSYLISRLKMFKDTDGLSAAVITQLTDVETELDGFMTYDRAIIKMPVADVKKLNRNLIISDP